MKIVSIVTLFAICMCQLGFVVAQGRVPIASPVALEPGKPDHGTGNRELSGWSTKSSKTSKSTDQPTLFPTLYPTLYPTFSPTYCGKASKSWWHSGSRKLGDWSTKSSKSESCHSGSRSWGHRRQARRLYSEKREGNGRDLRQDEEDTDEAMFKTDEIKERRRINGGKPTKADDPVY